MSTMTLEQATENIEDYAGEFAKDFDIDEAARDFMDIWDEKAAEAEKSSDDFDDARDFDDAVAELVDLPEILKRHPAENAVDTQDDED